MKGWVGLVGWPIEDGLPTLVVTHQLQVERRTEKVRRPETDVLPLCHATNLLLLTWFIVSYFILLFMTCFSIVMVSYYLYRAAVSASFSLVVLLIMYCVVKSHFILLFEQIKKRKRKKPDAKQSLSVTHPLSPYTYFYYLYSITHSLFPSRLKSFLFCKSSLPQPFLFLLQDWW